MRYSYNLKMSSKSSICGAEVTIDRITITVTKVYFYSYLSPEQGYTNLSYLQFNQKMVIGDFNAHSRTWKDRTTPKGHAVASWADRPNLSLHSTTETTTYRWTYIKLSSPPWTYSFLPSTP